MIDVRHAFLLGADVVVDAVARPDVASQWDAPSALPGMSTGALAAHLARALVQTDSYLDAPQDDRPLIDAVGYYVSFPGINDRDSDLSRDVLGRAEQTAAPGADAIAALARTTRDALAVRIPAAPPDTTVAVIGGRRLTLDEFLCTRCVEIAVHLDDLAASLAADLPIPVETATVAAETLVGFAVVEAGPAAVLRALARRERADSSVFPVL